MKETYSGPASIAAATMTDRRSVKHIISDAIDDCQMKELVKETFRRDTRHATWHVKRTV